MCRKQGKRENANRNTRFCIFLKLLLVKSEMKLQMGIKPFQSSVSHRIWMETEKKAALTVNICFC